MCLDFFGSLSKYLTNVVLGGEETALQRFPGLERIIL